MLKPVKKITVFLFIICSLIQASEIKDKSEKIIKGQFPKADLLFEKYQLDKNVKKMIELKARQSFFRNEVYLWRIKVDGKLAGIALLDNVLGKTMPITFITIFDLKGNLLDVEIVKYREDHGGQVRSKNWLSQFLNGKKYHVPGEDIDGISGATISVKSVTKGINKLQMLIDEIIKNEKL